MQNKKQKNVLNKDKKNGNKRTEKKYTNKIEIIEK